MTITPETIENLESDCIHIAEVAVGKEGGSVGGASIDTSTDRLGQVKKTFPKILEEMQDISTSVESHNNNPLAHGMTAPGAAIVQAATVADQRAVMGLANHNLLTVDATGNISAAAANLGGLVYARSVVTATPEAGHYWICVGEFNYMAQVQVQVRLTSNNHEELLRIDVAHTYHANQARITVARHSYNSKVRSVAISSPAHGNKKHLWVEVDHGEFSIICSAWADGLGFISHPASVRANGSQPTMTVSCGMMAGYGWQDTSTYYGGAPSANHYQGGVIAHNADNAYSFGTAALRASVVYAASGTINTSDAREKTSVTALSAAEIQAAKLLAAEIGTYQWLASIESKGADARKHIGMTVQRAIEVMESCGLDPFAYGFICFDEWGAVENEAGETTQDAGNRYSFRPDELLFFIARGFEARLAALEAK